MQTLTSTDPASPELLLDPTAQAPSRAKPFNIDLRDRLSAYRTENSLSTTALARELGTNPTAISKYLNGKPEGDVVKLESVIEDVLKNGARRSLVRVELFETSVTQQVAKICEAIRKTNDVGLIYGDAGVGKTSGVRLYLSENPSAVGLEIPKWNSDRSGLESALFGALETRAWDGRTRRADFIAAKLEDSNRLIVVDNAHKLTPHARAWLFDMHDATRCPIALVGNPEVLKEIRKNDQHFSRIGICREVKLRKDAAQVAAKLTAQLDPEAVEATNDLGARVVSERGHLRALRKEVILAAELRSSPELRGDYRQSFLAAHTQLVRDYAL